jgi:hypothetical protein
MKIQIYYKKFPVYQPSATSMPMIRIHQSDFVQENELTLEDDIIEEESTDENIIETCK